LYLILKRSLGERPLIFRTLGERRTEAKKWLESEWDSMRFAHIE